VRLPVVSHSLTATAGNLARTPGYKCFVWGWHDAVHFAASIYLFLLFSEMCARSLAGWSKWYCVLTVLVKNRSIKFTWEITGVISTLDKQDAERALVCYKWFRNGFIA
jgi:hypothetical protein